jgi:hypothetical protein
MPMPHASRRRNTSLGQAGQLLRMRLPLKAVCAERVGAPLQVPPPAVVVNGAQRGRRHQQHCSSNRQAGHEAGDAMGGELGRHSGTAV